MTWRRLGRRLGKECPNQRQEGARFALFALTFVNLLNFADRYVPASVKELIKDDLDLTDAETALPTTGMVVVFMVAAFFFGIISDRDLVDRRWLLAGAVAFWSVATGLAGLSRNLTELILYRSLVGVGEAAYSTIAPPLIADFFPARDRQVAYGLFYLAIPVGGAVGYGVGAVLGGAFGWRIAFIGCGLPGMAAALLVLMINDPVRGINDPYHDPIQEAVEQQQQRSRLSTEDADDGAGTSTSSSDAKTARDVPSTTWQHDILLILRNMHYVSAVAGMTANNFALGALAEWFATFLYRFQGSSLEEAGLVVGAITVVAGIGGNILGAKTAAHYEDKCKSSYFLTSALYTFPAMVLLFLAINVPNSPLLVYFLLLVSEVFIWTNLAPINTVSFTVIPPSLRARSAGLQILAQHMLGDVISPPIVGLISDETGSLRAALQITWVMVGVSGLCWWAGYHYLPPLPISKHTGNTEEEPISFMSFLCRADPAASMLLDSEGRTTSQSSMLEPEGVVSPMAQAEDEGGL